MEKADSRNIESCTKKEQEFEIKVYPRRWLILAIFCIFSASNAIQWIQYSIIETNIQTYYQVTSSWVNMTSLIFMIAYIPLVFPASWFLDKYGLRYAVLAGSLGNALGAWIKVFSVATNKFWLTLIGQTVAAISQIFVLAIPARLAAIWFGDNQVSSACTIGVLGNQLGIAIGFYLPPKFVPQSNDLNNIASGLQFMFYSMAFFCSIIFVIILLFFRDRPPHSPSITEAKNQTSNKLDNIFSQSIKKMMTNGGFVLLLITYGINVGCYYAICTKLSVMIEKHFPGSSDAAGDMGLISNLVGMGGAIICGVILDKTHKFKEITLGLYVLSFGGFIIFLVSLITANIILAYLAISLMGFFMTAYAISGFEMTVELTYPEPEGTSAGLLNGAAQVFGILFIQVYQYVFDTFNEFTANVVLCGCFLVGTVLSMFIPNKLRRQNAKN